MISAENPWDPFVVSAPGKVILFGEHAAVYGKAAIAGSLSLRLYALITPRNDTKVRIVLPDIEIDSLFEICNIPELDSSSLSHPDEILNIIKEPAQIPSGPGKSAVLSFIYLYACLFSSSMRSSGFTLCVRSTLPVGAGLGSSASYNVTLAAALLKITRQLESNGMSMSDKELINSWAFRGEQVAHGTPSGIDNSIATYGGFLLYQKGRDIIKIQSANSLRVLITNTNIPKSTKALIAKVRDLRDKYPLIIDPILDSIHNISLSAAKLFQETKPVENEGCLVDHLHTLEEHLRDIAKINHGLLATAGVSHPTLERIREITESRDMTSKLTGAGGGGCALTLIPNDTDNANVQSVIQELVDEGFSCYKSVVGGDGVSVHQSIDTIPVTKWIESELDEVMSLIPNDQPHTMSSPDPYNGVISGFIILPQAVILKLSK